jgi:hypothetical protein
MSYPFKRPPSSTDRAGKVFDYAIFVQCVTPAACTIIPTNSSLYKYNLHTIQKAQIKKACADIAQAFLGFVASSG